mgnify:CR=1 FL=1
MAARDMIARRSDYKEALDDFPTPPWATRALFEHVVGDSIFGESVLEPACGQGHMTKVLEEQGADVHGFDINSKFGHDVMDFREHNASEYDWVITNPPYKLVNEFFEHFKSARKGLALLLRIQWLTGQSRYNNIYSKAPPSFVAVFSRRMSAAQGRVVQENSPLFDHAWFVWDLASPVDTTELVWIPPTAQKELENEEDYQ